MSSLNAKLLFIEIVRGLKKLKIFFFIINPLVMEFIIQYTPYKRDKRMFNWFVKHEIIL